MSRVFLQGELFKQGKDTWSSFNLRWVELLHDGTFSWHDKEGAQSNGTVNLRNGYTVCVDMERSQTKDGEERYGFRLIPPNGRMYVLQASSFEERSLWVTAIDTVAHPEVVRHEAGLGRVIQVKRPPKPGKLGLDIGSGGQAGGLPCALVLRLSGELAGSGLHPGDCILSVNQTVLRNSLAAARAFGREEQSLTLRLLGWSREVRVAKHAGVAGLSCTRPARGPGVLVSGITHEGGAHEAGLHVGDRILAVNNEVVLNNDHEAASKRILSATGDVRLVVSGVTLAALVRKDADGRLGVGFVTGEPQRHMQGAVVCECVPRGEAARGGVRVGDVLVAVDDTLITDAEHALAVFAATARAVRLVLWRPHSGSASDGKGAGVAQIVRSTPDAKPATVPGGKQPWVYYANAVAKAHQSGLPVYEDLTLSREAHRRT